MKMNNNILKSNLLCFSLVIASLLITHALIAKANEPTPVVATFSIIGDMVKRIGGEHINLTVLVGANGDTHVYKPTPADARAVSEAKVLIVNGLGFEGWLERLINASDFEGTQVVTTTGIEPIPYAHEKQYDDAHEKHHDDHHHGTYDPHAWQSLDNAVVYVDNITAALAQADPSNAATFYQNRATYVMEIQALHDEIKGRFAKLSEQRRTVVTAHDAFAYFGRGYGLKFLAPQGMSSISEASAKEVAGLIVQMREQGASSSMGAVFIENITDSRLIQQIANETGATVSGTLYPGALSDSRGPAPTYLDMMRHNATTLIRALSTKR